MRLTLYELNADADKFLAVEPVDDDDDELFMKGFNGRPMAHNWSVPEARFVDDHFSAQQLQGDLPHLFRAVPVMSAKASCAALRGPGLVAPSSLAEADLLTPYASLRYGTKPPATVDRQSARFGR
ncbi:MAG: hypothetical protein M3N47_03660 [Chloroflexota bacterium]|nr:hypothetical protein [Chloroflexota bacterium]